LVVAFTEAPYRLKGVLQRGAARECALHGTLNHGAVRRRIAERITQLDDARAIGDEGMHQAWRRGIVGIPGGKVGNQRLAALFLQACETRLDSAHAAALDPGATG